jgi:hypothetical protein
MRQVRRESMLTQQTAERHNLVRQSPPFHQRYACYRHAVLTNCTHFGALYVPVRALYGSKPLRSLDETTDPGSSRRQREMSGVGRRVLVALSLIVAAAVVPANTYAAAPAPASASVQRPAVTQAPDEQSARLAARQTGRRVEVMSGRTETTRVFANPSSTLTVEAHAQPFQVRRGAGWVPVDTRLRIVPDAGVSPVATVTDLVLSAGGAGPVARLSYQGRELSLGWPAPLSAPRLSGDTATYADVLPGVDLVLRATADGVSELLIVRTPQAASNPALARVRFTTAATGLSLSAGADGGLVATDAAGGPVFSAGAPSMWEAAVSSSSQPRRAPVRLEVGSGDLRLVPDARMLADPTMRFPLTIDPFVTLALGQWGNLSASHPNRSIAADPFRGDGARVGLHCDWSGCDIVRSVFAFPAAAIYGKHILSAVLTATLIHSPSCTDTPVELWLTGGINDRSTWNNTRWLRRLDTRSAHAADGCAGPVPVLFGGGLAGAVQDAANQRPPDVTVGLRAANEFDIRQAKLFQPDVILSVEYNSFPNQPTSLDTAGKGCTMGAGRPFVATLTPQVKAFVSDPDQGQSLDATFEFWHAGGSLITTVQQNFLGNGTFAIVSAPAGALADGGAYSWRVIVNDGVDSSPFSAFCEFSIDATPPNPAKQVISTDYPNDGSFHGSVGRSGHFTLVPPDAQPEHVAGYMVGLTPCDAISCATSVPASPVDHSGSVDLTPALVASNALMVWTVNRAGLAGDPLTYTFLVRSATGPAADWHMSEGAGATAADASGHGNTATLVGGSGWTTGRSNAGPALAVDGSTGYAATAGPVQTRNLDTGTLAPIRTDRSYTVAAWVKPSAVSGTGQNPTAVSSDGSRASAFLLGYTSGGASWRFDVTSSDADNAAVAGVAGSTPVQTDRWTFVAASYDSGSRVIRLYVNGVEEGNATIAGTFDSAGPMVLGRGRSLGQLDHFFPGAIGEVRVWDRLVTATDLQVLARPLAPSVTLPGGSTARLGTPVQVMFSANGDANVMRYIYSLDDPALASPLTATPASPGGPVTVSVTPDTADFHTIFAAAVDARGRIGPLASQDIQVLNVPGAPVAVSATAVTTGQATVTWFSSSDGGSPITGFTVIASPGGLTTSVVGDTEMATVTGLTSGTAYTFTVIATNALGTGPASDPSNSVIVS